MEQSNTEYVAHSNGEPLYRIVVATIIERDNPGRAKSREENAKIEFDPDTEPLSNQYP